MLRFPFIFVFTALPSTAGIYTLCPSLHAFNVPQSVKSYGYLKSPSYPLPVVGAINCSTALYLTQPCTALRLEFLDFYLMEGNYLIIQDHIFTDAITYSSAVLDVNNSQSVVVNLSFTNPQRITRQRFLIKYLCGEFSITEE